MGEGIFFLICVSTLFKEDHQYKPYRCIHVSAHVLRDGAQRQLHVFFGRFNGNAQLCGDLFMFQVLVPAEEVHFLLLWRQLGDRHVYQRPVILFRRRFMMGGDLFKLAGPAQLPRPFVGFFAEAVECMVPGKDK